MALTYNKATRDLSIKGTITFNDGTQLHVTDSDILNYSFDPQIGSEGLPLGSTEATSYRLELSNVGKTYSPEKFDNAEVHMFVGIKTNGEYVYDDFGVWYVDECSVPEQSVSMNLSGYDALATRFSAFYEDDKGVYPTTIGSIAQTACLAAGIRLKSISFPNAAVTISKMPAWEEETTLRDILSYCAICAAGYVRIARNGQLEIASFADGSVHEIDPSLYQTFTQTGGAAFKFNSIEAILDKDEDKYSRFAVDATIESNATNTIQIEYNPLLTNSIVNSIVSELRGITMEPGELIWGGDPDVMCGDYYNVETLNGDVVKIMVTAQSFTFDGGLSVSERCDLPTLNTQTSATYSTSTNMYDAKGNIKATRISGLDKKVIAATTGHFENLTAETAEFDDLYAALLNVINLVANKIDAETIKSGTITTDKLASGAITAEKLQADIIDAVSIDAIVAHIEKIVAEQITTDRLYAALASFDILNAGTGNFDRATVEHLVANLFNLTGSGVMEDVFIHNLQLAYAQIVSASIGSLVLQDKNGGYYEIGIELNDDGTTEITANPVYPSEEEKINGVYGTTKPIIATQMAVDDMAATTVKATQAVINKVIAARIDVDELFANTAFVNKLVTSNIVSGKSLTIISEEALKAADAAKNAAKTFRQETSPTQADNVKTGDIWVKPSTGEIYQANAISFALDDEGNLYLVHSDNDGYYAIISPDDPYLMEYNFDMSIAADGTYSKTPIIWSVVRDSGLAGQIEKNTTAGVDVEYCLWTSEVDAPYKSYSGWQTYAPEQTEGMFIWSRTATRLKSGVVFYSDPICISPSLGKNILSITEQYAIGSSKETVPDESSWKSIPDERPEDYYLWTRSLITFVDGTTTTTPPQVNILWELEDSALAAKSIAESAGAVAKQAVDDLGNIPNYIEEGSDGLYIKDIQGASTMKLNSGSVSIGTVAGAAQGFSQFAANYVQFGSYQLRRAADGGLVFRMT